MDANIIVYGAEDCDDTQRTRKFLDAHGTRYTFTNIDHDKAAEELVKKENDGKRRTPLVQVCVGTECRVLRVPSDEALADALRDIDPLENAA